MKKKHIVVVGGGPAGSASVLSIANIIAQLGANRFEITQVCAPDKGQHAIGETIPPAATRYLSELGVVHLLDDTVHLPCPGSMSVWGSDTPGFNDFFYTPVGQGYHLNRKLFNQGLQREVDARGVKQLVARVTSANFCDDGICLNLDVNGGSVQQQADFVVDACGIQACVARSLGVARNQYDSVISACAFYSLPASPDKPAFTLVSAVEHGWWYGTQLPQQQALICFCTDSENLKQLTPAQPQNWFELLSQSGWFYEECCDQFGIFLSEPERVDFRAAPSAILSCVIGDHWLACGDAASSYDSMTSAGITKALQQGLDAGRAIIQLFEDQDDGALQQYQQRIFAEFNQYLRLHQELYKSEQRFADSKFWQRRRLQ